MSHLHPQENREAPVNAQPQMFPPTREERLATIRSYLADNVERRSEAVTRAMVKLSEAQDMLREFDEAMEERHETVPQSLEVTGDGSGTVLPPDTGIVTVIGDGLEPFTVDVGSRTRFSALIFAYAEQVGIADVEVDEWNIVCTGDGENVLPSAVVTSGDYGMEFRVERGQS